MRLIPAQLDLLYGADRLYLLLRKPPLANLSGFHSAVDGPDGVGALHNGTRKAALLVKIFVACVSCCRFEL
jgi:hypothetical protein